MSSTATVVSSPLSEVGALASPVSSSAPDLSSSELGGQNFNRVAEYFAGQATFEKDDSGEAKLVSMSIEAVGAGSPAREMGNRAESPKASESNFGRLKVGPVGYDSPDLIPADKVREPEAELDAVKTEAQGSRRQESILEQERYTATYPATRKPSVESDTLIAQEGLDSLMARSKLPSLSGLFTRFREKSKELLIASFKGGSEDFDGANLESRGRSVAILVDKLTAVRERRAETTQLESRGAQLEGRSGRSVASTKIYTPSEPLQESSQPESVVASASSSGLHSRWIKPGNSIRALEDSFNGRLVELLVSGNPEEIAAAKKSLAIMAQAAKTAPVREMALRALMTLEDSEALQAEPGSRSANSSRAHRANGAAESETVYTASGDSSLAAALQGEGVEPKNRTKVVELVKVTAQGSSRSYVERSLLTEAL